MISKKPIMKNVINLKILLILLILILGCKPAFNEPTGFRDLKWGDNVNEIDGMVLTKKYSNKNFNWANPEYTRKGDKLKIGPIDLKEIRYQFYEDRLYGIYVTWEPIFGSNLTMIKILTQKYGNPTREGIGSPYAANWMGPSWSSDNIWIFLDKNMSNGFYVLSYTYVPILNKLNKCLEESPKLNFDYIWKEGAKDL